jgi:subtilisin family serine protease
LIHQAFHRRGFIMDRHTYKAFYIIALWAILGTLAAPGGHNTAHAQIQLPSVGSDVTRLPPDLGIDRRVRSRVENTADTAADVTQTAEAIAAQTAAQAAGLATGLIREVLLGQDPNGADIELRTVMVLVATGQRNALVQPGFEIIAERELAALGMTLVTLRMPINADLPQAVEQLRDANPAAAVDYNHLYEWTDGAAENSLQDSGVDDATTAGAADKNVVLRVGIIDSAVMRDHPAIRTSQIVARDFATVPGFRPETHGTAVASLVAESSQQQATIYSASVFFQMPNHAPGSTAESLVAALDWLAAERVDVINMSLAGPGNRLLEAAIEKLQQMNSIIVAAVGNNGPSGAPLYPAAYDGVIGVTAVDKRNKIFRYANRGDQVAFAARGVNVRVADSLSGGWRIESGTSMASPHVAVVVARLLRSDTVRPGAVKSWLIANAEDLGRKGFDPVYGYGLITQPPIVFSMN